MTWFDFPGWGMYELNGVAEKELASTGAHGYATQAEAQAKPNAGPDAEQATLLQTFNAASIAPVGAAGISGVLLTPHSTGGVSGVAANAAKAAVNAAKSSIFGAATQPAIWVRAGEVLLGLILLAVGLARITNAIPAATKIATRVGAVGLA